MKKPKKNKSKNFKDYKLKIINGLVHESDISSKQQQEIFDFENRKELVEYLDKALSSYEKGVLKKLKIPPFHKGNSYLKIIPTPMGNKR